MYFSQETIDQQTFGRKIMANNPLRGTSRCPTAKCFIVPDPNEPTLPLKWKPSADSTDESTWHNIGITFYPGNHIGYQIYDFKDVADAYHNIKQTTLNTGFQGKLVSIGCIPLVPLDRDSSFYFENAADAGASSMFVKPNGDNYEYWVPSSNSYQITRFYIPYNNYWTGVWKLRSRQRPTKPVPCIWFAEVGNDPYVTSCTVPASSAGNTMSIPMPSDNTAEIESICIVPRGSSSISKLTFKNDQIWYVSPDIAHKDVMVPSPLTTNGRNVFMYYSNRQIPSKVTGFPKIQISCDSMVDFNIRYVDPNM